MSTKALHETFALAGLMAVCAACPAAAADVSLVADGAAKAVVVLAADASESERFAAAELAKWTRELTGADMPVCASPRDGMTSVRFVRGDADVRHDGFSLTASPGEIVIAANKPIGMLFGVYYLLGRFGGIYWCHPDSGADFAPRRDLAVPAGRLVKTPMIYRMSFRPPSLWRMHRSGRPSMLSVRISSFGSCRSGSPRQRFSCRDFSMISAGLRFSGFEKPITRAPALINV